MSLPSEHRVRVYLNQPWKIVAPSSEWRWHFYNNKFWIGDHFFHHFSQPLCIVISLFLLIKYVRMTTSTHQLLSRKTSTPEISQCSCWCLYCLVLYVHVCCIVV